MKGYAIVAALCLAVPEANAYAPPMMASPLRIRERLGNLFSSTPKKQDFLGELLGRWGWWRGWNGSGGRSLSSDRCGRRPGGGDSSKMTSEDEERTKDIGGGGRGGLNDGAWTHV